MTRSDSLTPSLRFPTRGYTQSLFDEISSPGPQGLSSFRISLRSMSPLIPRRWGPLYVTLPSRSLLPSLVIDRLGHQISVLRGYVCVRFRCNLELCQPPSEILSEGFAVLLSLHSASQATRP